MLAFSAFNRLSHRGTIAGCCCFGVLWIAKACWACSGKQDDRVGIGEFLAERVGVVGSLVVGS